MSKETLSGKQVSITMSVPFDDVVHLLNKNLAPPPSSGDPPIASNTLIYNLCLEQTKTLQAEERCQEAQQKQEKAEGKQRVVEEALAVAMEHLCHCTCGRGHFQEGSEYLSVPAAHYLRRSPSSVLRGDNGEGTRWFQVSLMFVTNSPYAYDINILLGCEVDYGVNDAFWYFCFLLLSCCRCTAFISNNVCFAWVVIYLSISAIWNRAQNKKCAARFMPPWNLRSCKSTATCFSASTMTTTNPDTIQSALIIKASVVSYHMYPPILSFDSSRCGLSIYSHTDLVTFGPKPDSIIRTSS
jgi:hypothetical protein